MTTTAPATTAGAPARHRRRPRLTGRPRRLVRATHVVVAGGWVGLVVSMLVLGITASTATTGVPPETTYRVMHLLGGTATPPLAVATLLTGVALSLLTPWGLVRHWWIVVKTVLGLVVIVTAVTLTDAWLHQAITSSPATTGTRLVVTSGTHLVLLVLATVISVDKPWGRTRYGRRPTPARKEQP